MRKYFYTDGTNNFGPFTYEELREKNITRETYIWFQGLGEWSLAGKVAELNDLFKLVPPPRAESNATYIERILNQPIPKVDNDSYATRQTPPKTWLVESILATLFCCLPFGIVGIINAAKVESRFYAEDFEGATRYSDNAKKWATISFWLGLVGGALTFIITFMGNL